MEKDFDRWNEHKKKLDLQPGILFHEREIWWCSIGVNVGSEQHSQTGDFSRPVLVFRKWSQSMFWGIPLTTKLKELEFRYSFSVGMIQNQALITQMRSFDNKRLIRKIHTLEEDEFLQLKEIIIGYIEKTEPATSAGSSEAEATV